LAVAARLLTPYFPGGGLERAGALTALVGVGIVLYFAAGHFLGAYRIADLKRLANRGPTRRSAKAG